MVPKFKSLSKFTVLLRNVWLLGFQSTGMNCVLCTREIMETEAMVLSHRAVGDWYHCFKLLSFYYKLRV